MNDEPATKSDVNFLSFWLCVGFAVCVVLAFVLLADLHHVTGLINECGRKVTVTAMQHCLREVHAP